DEYLQLFNAYTDYCYQLKRIAIGGHLRSCRFRSICWRLFLDCIPEVREEWLIKTRQLRKEYDEIVAKHYVNPYQSSSDNFIENNPLSQTQTSPWNIYFQDNELKSTINQDVVRTFPEVDFFHSPAIQASMCNILFHFAKQNPKLGYKQGMHEVLAPILFVVHSDQQAFLHASEIQLLKCADESVSKEIGELLDPKYAEHDTYTIFSQIMEIIGLWYSQDTPAQKFDSMNVEPFSNSNDNSHSFLSIKLKMIFEQILKRKAPDLYCFLETMQIAPQIFGIRWLRLLFGREYSMQDLLVVWDAIFADGVSFSLCDYIFVSMLIVIKKLLLSSSYSECMAYLMKYPNVPDVHYIINLSFHLRDPLNYSAPNEYSPHIMPITNDINYSSKIVVAQEEVSVNEKVNVINSTQKASRPRTLSLRKKKSVDSIDTGVDAIKSLAETPSSSEKNVAPKQMVKEMEIMDGLAAAESTENKINYCWTLINDQIRVLQKCLSEEENLKNEDAIFIALAELKKVRDILKGTLKLPEEVTTS
ncbi:TBC1 domain family member 5-like protein, partial [Dinothrombium tinctorium]